MAIYSLSLRATLTAHGSVFCEIRTGAQRARILEVGYSSALSSTRRIGLGRPSVRGSGSTEVTMLPDDPASPTATVTMAIAWNATNFTYPPSLPSTAMRSAALDSQATIVWRFPNGLIMGSNDSLALWNLGNGGNAEVWAVVDE